MVVPYVENDFYIWRKMAILAIFIFWTVLITYYRELQENIAAWNLLFCGELQAFHRFFANAIANEKFNVDSGVFWLTLYNVHK